MDAFIAALTAIKPIKLDTTKLSTITCDQANWVVPGRLMTGPVPSNKTMMDAIMADGIDTFVCLQQEISPVFYTAHIYSAKKPMTIHFPVEDRCVPSKKEFVKHITTLIDLMCSGRNIYIHCYGGHGRTGLYVCAVLGCLYPELRKVDDALYFFQSVHNMRSVQKNHFFGVLPARVADSDIQRAFLVDFFAMMSFCV